MYVSTKPKHDLQLLALCERGQREGVDDVTEQGLALDRLSDHRGEGAGDDLRGLRAGVAELVAAVAQALVVFLALGADVAGLVAVGVLQGGSAAVAAADLDLGGHAGDLLVCGAHIQSSLDLPRSGCRAAPSLPTCAAWVPR